MRSSSSLTGYICACRIIPLILLLLSGGCIQQPGNITAPDQLVIYPQPPATTRIQYLTSFSSSRDFGIEQSSFNRFVFGEEEARPIVKPYGITSKGSRIYICDTGSASIIILDTSDGSFYQFTPGGFGRLQLPLNCDIDGEGSLYIADGNRKQVVIFDSELNYRGAITIKGGFKPTDVEVDSASVYVSVIDNHRVEVYDRLSLKLIRSFPSVLQDDPSWLYQPSNIEISGDKLLISDPGDCTLKIFSKDGTFLSSFGSPGRGFGQFTRPRGVSADSAGNIYVVDAAFENVQIFNSDGVLLLPFGGTYNGPGGMWLPSDVAIDYDNLDYFSKWVDPSFRLEYLIYVTNQYGPDRVSVYGFVGLTK